MGIPPAFLLRALDEEIELLIIHVMRSKGLIVNIFLLIGLFFIVTSCDKDSDTKTTTTQTSETALPLSKIVSVSLDRFFGCALDDQGKSFCFKAPSKPIKGSNVADYPIKSNDDLAKDKFINVFGGHDGICGINDQGKLVCFTPEDKASISPTALAGLGKFKKVAGTEKGFICAIDLSDKLSCHKLDFSTSIENDDYVSAEEILELTFGESNNKTFGCFIAQSNSLQCELFAQISAKPKPPKEEASKLAKGIEIGEPFGTLSKDKKVIKYFGFNRKDPLTRVSDLDLNGKYSDIIVSGSALCGIIETTEELKCQLLANPHTIAEKTNNSIGNEKFKTIAAGYNFTCGLHSDNTVFCWRPKSDDLPVYAP